MNKCCNDKKKFLQILIPLNNKSHNPDTVVAYTVCILFSSKITSKHSLNTIHLLENQNCVRYFSLRLD